MTGPDSREPSLTRRAFVQATVCTGAAGLVAAAGEPSAVPAFLAGSDWPMYRHDPALSAASPIRGGLAEAPRVDPTHPRPTQAAVSRNPPGTAA
jgi:hypothetical protein